MAQKTTKTVIVLRNDSTTAWANSDYQLLPGEVGVGYMTRDDGTQVPIVKIGDGNTVWSELPQAEGVFEKDVVLTAALGKYTPSSAGYVKVPNSKGMTTSELLLDALSSVEEPTIEQPSITTTASIVGGGELGSYVTGVTWDGTFTDGSYQYGSTESTGTGTGLSASNVTWNVSNSIDGQTAETEDGTFTFEDNYPQINSESSKTYVTVTAKYALDASAAYTPLNNVGEETTGKIASITEKTNTAKANATGYRKPFWGVKTASIDIDNITSAQVRALGKSGTQTKGFPSSLAVPAGSTQVIFCAKAGTYKTLTAKDGNAMNANVTFTKKANAVSVEGANGYTATAYDMWYVQWEDPIASAKSLSLTWS